MSVSHGYAQVNLHALRVYGNGVKCLPSSVGQLTKLTSLTNSFASREGYQRAGFCTIIPPEAAGRSCSPAATAPLL